MKRGSLKILVTAGPTREPIDPVRFISNYSTGSMGYAVAAKAVKRGNKVILISGPSRLASPQGARRINVNTALEMKKQTEKFFNWCDCLIMTAAVSDYRVAKYSQGKIKSGKKTMMLKLVKNPDILNSLGKKKKEKILVGFSLESRDLISNAIKKMRQKNLDFVVANRIEKNKLPFGDRRVSAFIIDKKHKIKKISGATKQTIAGAILEAVAKHCCIKAR
jgi:phosphopantothenoylcysteine decarboxylase/phosphopantothenate--cysteine ligase